MTQQTNHGRLYLFVSSYPRLILAAALLLSVLALFYTYRKMEFLTGRDSLMPRNAPFQQAYQAYRQEFGDQDDIVVVIESDDAELSTRCTDALYERLKREQAVFREIFYPGGLPFFRKNGLLFMPLEDIRGLRNTLTMAAPVLTDLAQSPTVQTLFTSLTRQIDSYLANPDVSSLASLTFMLKTLDTGFKAFGAPPSGSGNAAKPPPLSMDSFLKGGGGGKPSTLESVGKQQVITLLPVRDDTSFVPAEKAILAARGALRETLQKPEFKGVRGGLTGVPVLEHEEMASSQKDMEIATILSLALTVVLLLLAFRGILNVIAAMVSLITAICISFGFATLAVGHLNILSMVFAIMLIGLGIEYSIQVVLRYQEELGRGVGQGAALDTALSRNILTIIMAAATVALAFATFIFTDFTGIAELGIIAAGGIGICVITTFTVLPAMLILLERFRKPAIRATTAPTSDDSLTEPHPLLKALFSRPRTISAITIVLSLVCIYPLSRTSFDYNMMNLQAKGLESVEFAYKLMRSKDNAGYFAVVTARDAVEADRLTKALEKLPTVDHVVSMLTFTPDQQKEKLTELAALKKVMEKVKPVPYEENLRVMELPTVFENFRNRVEKLKNSLETAQTSEAKPVGSFLVTLDSFFKSLEKEKERNALGMLREFQGGMFAQLPDKLKMMKESLDAAAVSEADIPEQLRKRFVGKTGKLQLQVAPKHEIFDREPLEAFVKEVRSVAPTATGEPVNVHDSMNILRSAYLWAFGYAFIGIAIILLVTFRSITYALLGIVPLISGLLLMVGGMWLSGIRFNVANIIVMPLLLGVGIDSAIYIINRYRREDETPLRVITGSSGVGVLLNALTILFSFGALMVARHQGVFSIGAVMSLGMTAVVAVFLVFLPALLMMRGKK